MVKGRPPVDKSKPSKAMVVTIPFPKKTEHWLVVDGKVIGEVEPVVKKP